MLTKKEILLQLEEDGVDMGKTPSRTFVYYQQMGLLPLAEKHEFRRREVVFPGHTMQVIKNIRRHLEAGGTLAEFKQGLENNKRKRLAISQALGIEYKEQSFAEIDFSFTQNFFEMGKFIMVADQDKITFISVDETVSLMSIDDKSKIKAHEQITIKMRDYEYMTGAILADMAKSGKLHFNSLEIHAEVIKKARE